jgi:hypothetical protein
MVTTSRLSVKERKDIRAVEAPLFVVCCAGALVCVADALRTAAL